MNTDTLTDVNTEVNTEAETPSVSGLEESNTSETVTANETDEPKKNYIAKWQEQLGVEVTGVMSGQIEMFKPSIYMIEPVTYEGGGCDLVRILQFTVGVGVSGLFNMSTARQLQKWLIHHGYDCGPYQADGFMGPDSVSALIQSIEDEAWKR